MSHASAEDVRKSIRIYIGVFVALAALTIVTVAVSRLHLSFASAVLVAMVVAVIKGTLVAGYFMHLFSEQKIIYATLVICIVFFVALMWIPSLTARDNVVVEHITPAQKIAPPGGHETGGGGGH